MSRDSKFLIFKILFEEKKIKVLNAVLLVFIKIDWPLTLFRIKSQILVIV